jgi:hypothetical protein
MATTDERLRARRTAETAVEQCPQSQAHLDQYGSDSTYATAYDNMVSSLSDYQEDPTDANADALKSDVDSWASAKNYEWHARTK